MLYLLRLFLLGVHFLVAGVINLVIVLRYPFDRRNSARCGRVYSLPALRLLGVQVHLQDQTLREQKTPCIIVANHQSNYDLFMLGCVVPPRTVTIGKKSLRWIPIFGQIFWLAGNVLIERGNAAQAKEAMLKTTDTLQNDNTSIWVFVEGTRNLGKGLLPFKKGAFQMAINAGVPIVPLCCNTYKNSLRLNRWRSGQLVIRTLPAIATTGMTLDDMPALMERCRDQMAACIASLDAQVERRAALPL
jgi:1-acyl-sn-glycerol-3-phosphate acyltransferase